MDDSVATFHELDRAGLVAIARLAQLIESHAEPLELEPAFVKLRGVVDDAHSELMELYARPAASIEEAYIRQTCENDFQMKNVILSELNYEMSLEQVTALRIAWEMQPFLGVL
eukprot:GEMP01083546.1.p1 GENE.GEMP01083546.1~~GEMP01083546.1.p1  ORF type:complete len:113 (+),score=36.25 GEMP01083546.1:91-429(+)